MTNLSDTLHGKRYALITAAYNEEKVLEHTIQAVISQTLLPVKWVVVDDGSTDRTPEIVGCYARHHKFIKLVRLNDQHPRDFTARIYAINIGYETIRDLETDFIGNLDADIAFEPVYFDALLEKFRTDEYLGLAGGFLYEHDGRDFKPRKRNNIRSVPNAVQMFRRECYEVIGGYLPLKYGSPDWCAEVQVRMRGWRVQSFPDLKVLHLRPTGSVDGRLWNSYRAGLGAVYMGSHPIFEVLKCIYRIPDSPFLLGSLFRFSGLLAGYWRQDPRIVSADFIRFLRKEQKDRMWCYFGK
jgi:glycosyltransferase involved in cell wall biosynthesis